MPLANPMEELQQVRRHQHLPLHYCTNRTIIQGVLDIVGRHRLRVVYRYADTHKEGIALLLFFFQHAMIGVALDVAKTDDHKFIPNGG